MLSFLLDLLLRRSFARLIDSRLACPPLTSIGRAVRAPDFAMIQCLEMSGLVIRMSSWPFEASIESTTSRQPKSVASLSSYAESILHSS